MTAYDTVLFDSDGVLVEPPAAATQTEATRAAFRAVGVEDVDRRSLDDIVTGVTVERLREICTTYDLVPDEFWRAREHRDERSQLEQFEAGNRTRYEDVAAIEGVEQRCGVVSNNHRSTIEFVLDAFDLESLFDTYYGRPKTVESLELKKPNPHYLECALDDLGGETALYVGDSECDVIAADRAGIDSAFVRRAHCGEVSLSTAPTYEVETLREVAEIVGE
ncbi:HAD family hydrolase [Natronococcus wangiae]|uniref:HAD family hydrolase n=1 Tax=Natronococcus wangiae TaxID=3068275 RepID=UPI00273E5D4B|nr:HAD-IA family hydrolase [Natronococcus sp. AD5]